MLNRLRYRHIQGYDPDYAAAGDRSFLLIGRSHWWQRPIEVEVDRDAMVTFARMVFDAEHDMRGVRVKDLWDLLPRSTAHENRLCEECGELIHCGEEISQTSDDEFWFHQRCIRRGKVATP